MRLTFEIIQESWTNQMRIDLASLYSLFDQLDKQYLLMDQWLEDWRDHLIHWFVPGNTAQQMIFISMIFKRLCCRRLFGILDMIVFFILEER